MTLLKADDVKNVSSSKKGGMLGKMMRKSTTRKNIKKHVTTRRSSKSAYICQVKFFYSFYIALGREMVPR